MTNKHIYIYVVYMFKENKSCTLIPPSPMGHINREMRKTDDRG